MFDIGFFEVLIIFVVGIILIGPEKLPEVLKYIFLTVRKIKDQFNECQKLIFLGERLQDQFFIDFR